MCSDYGTDKNQETKTSDVKILVTHLPKTDVETEGVSGHKICLDMVWLQVELSISSIVTFIGISCSIHVPLVVPLKLCPPHLIVQVVRIHTSTPNLYNISS